MITNEQKEQMKHFVQDYGYMNRPFFVKVTHEDTTLEQNMKNSLNRVDDKVGNDYEQPQSETPEPEDDGSVQSND